MTEPVIDPGCHDGALGDELAHLFGRGLLYTLIYVAQSLGAVLATPVLTRMLGTDRYGALAVVLAVEQFVAVVLGLGLSSGMQRVHADEGSEQSRGVLAVGSVAILVLGGVAAGTLPWWSSALGTARFEQPLWLGMAFAVGTAISMAAMSVLRARDALGSFLLVGVVQALGTQILGVAAVLALGPTPAAYLVGVVAGQAVAVILSLAAVRPRPVRGALRSTWTTLRFCLPFVPHTLSFLVLNLATRLVIEHDAPTAQVGRYQLAATVGTVVILFLSMLNQAWEPRIFAARGSRAQTALLRAARDVLASTLGPIVLAVSLAAPVAVRILGPRSFQAATVDGVVAVLALSAVPYAAYLGNLRVLLATRRTTSLMWAAPVAALANVGSAVVLVPRSPLLGAALSTFLGYGVLWVVTTFVARSKLRVPGSPPRLVVEIAALGIAALIVAALPAGGPGAVAGRAVAAVAVAGVAVRRVTAVHRSARRGSGPPDAPRRTFEAPALPALELAEQEAPRG